MQSFLQQKYQHLCPDQLPLAIVPPINENEAQFFLRGLEQGIFSIDEEGYVQTQLLPLPSGQNRKQKSIQLFWTGRHCRFLFREGVCQLSTVASLILKYGWSADQIAMEPGRRDFGKLGYGVDVVIRNAQRQIVVCGDVKRDARELQLLIHGFRYCCGVGPHYKDACRFKRDHAKYEFCSVAKPSYFFATAPGQEICFMLSHNGQVAIQKESSRLVYPADILASCNS